MIIFHCICNEEEKNNSFNFNWHRKTSFWIAIKLTGQQVQYGSNQTRFHERNNKLFILSAYFHPPMHIPFMYIIFVSVRYSSSNQQVHFVWSMLFIVQLRIRARQVKKKKESETGQKEWLFEMVFYWKSPFFFWLFKIVLRLVISMFLRYAKRYNHIKMLKR